MDYQQSTILAFKEACEDVKEFTSRPTDNELLQLYGLFKQAGIGDNNTSAPWAIHVRDRAKWDAWKSNSGKTKEQARQEYVDLVSSLTAHRTA